MPGAKNIQRGDGQQRLDKNFECPAADQAGVILGIVVEVEVECLRLLGLHDLAAGFPDLGLNAAPADGAHDRAIIAHQHLGRLERGDGAAHVDDGRQRTATPFPAQSGYLFIDVHRHHFN